MIAVLLVGLGGALGAMARHFVAGSVARRIQSRWPYGTLIINVTGCAAISLFVTLAAGKLAPDSPWRYLFPIGFVGAYTTFSTFEYDTFRLVENRDFRGALTYVLASTLAGFGAVALMSWLAR